MPEIGIDCGFFGRDREDVLPILCVKCRNGSTGCVGATVVDRKGASDYASSFLTKFIKSSVAPVIVMPAVPKVDRRRHVTKRDLVKYGYTDECQACTQLVSGMHNVKVPHDDRCRDRIGELEQVSGTVRPEVEIPRPEVGEEVDVGESTDRVARPGAKLS